MTQLLAPFESDLSAVLEIRDAFTRGQLLELLAKEQARDRLGRFAGGGSSGGGSGGSSRTGGTSASELADMHSRAEAGGFTYSPATHKFAATGFAVSPYPERTRVIPTKEFTPAHIAQYRQDNADLLAKPGHHLGAWREKDGDTDQVWLDVSIVSRDRAEAARVGRQFDQVAMFDLGKGETIDLGGTGGQKAHTDTPPVLPWQRAGAPPIRGPDLQPWEQDLRAALLLVDPVTRAAVLGELAKAQARDDRGRFAGGGGAGSSKPGPEQMHTVAAIRRTYEFSDPQTGLTATVIKPKKDGDPRRSTYVTIAIKDRDGNLVGEASRTIHESGQRSVMHGGMIIEREFQGKGFATRWNQQVEAQYRANGIEQIHLHATGGPMASGSYAWARAGYEFRGGSARSDVARHFERAAEPRPRGQEAHNLSPSVRAQIHKVANDPHSSPIDFAMIGWQPGATTWPGKELILEIGWDGVKTL